MSESEVAALDQGAVGGRRGGPRMARTLGLWAAVGLSLALVAPSQAVNINPQAAVAFVGRAVPLAFAAAFLAVLLVAYGVSRLAQRINGSGSLSTLVAQSVTHRAGAVTGWLLVGAYVLFVVVQAVTCAIFLGALLDGLGIARSISEWVYFTMAFGLLAVATLVASLRVHRAIGILTSFEVGTIVLIVVVMAIVAWTLLFGHGPEGQQFTWSVFDPTGGGHLGEAAVFGFLSFAGFEGAVALGEETRNPRHDIPFAVTGTVVFAGVFFVVVIGLEVMGFGTTPAGLQAFTASGALVGSLAQVYVTTWMADLIRIGIVVGAFSAMSGNIVGSSRVLYAVTRHGFPRAPFAHLQTRQAVPLAGNLVVSTVAGVFVAAWWLVLHQSPFATFAAAGTAGTLLILACYVLTSVGAGRQIVGRVDPSVPRWHVAIPTVAVGVLAYVFYQNVVPWPHGGEAWAIVVAAAWVVFAIGTVVHPPKRFSQFLGTDDSVRRDDTAVARMPI